METAPSPSRILVVDDHAIVRDALVSALLALNVCTAVATASSLAEVIDKLRKDADFDLIILDLVLEDVSGVQGMAYLREHFAHIPILVFSGIDSVDVIAHCFECGVHGYIPKSSSMPVTVNAIRIVQAGGTYIPPNAARLLGFEPTYPDIADAISATEQVHFTRKQREVFQQLIEGVPNKVIARRLDMAEGTVKAHLHSIYQQLRVRNRAQAILKSRQIQIVDSYA